MSSAIEKWAVVRTGHESETAVFSQNSRMTGPYLARFCWCPNVDNCDFAETPPSEQDPRAAQHCTRRLHQHLSSSPCLAQSGFEGTMEDYKNVSVLFVPLQLLLAFSVAVSHESSAFPLDHCCCSWGRPRWSPPGRTACPGQSWGFRQALPGVGVGDVHFS